MNKVLIVDFTPYGDELAQFFSHKEYSVEVCGSAFDAMSRLQSMDIDIIVAEVDLPGDNSFDLYTYIQDHYPYIPMIMITDRDMDSFFHRIFQEGIGNVLAKPVSREELLTLSEKLITRKNIFGLQSYMNGIIEKKKIRITSSSQIQKAVPLLLKELEERGYVIANKGALTLVLNEMVINAVYHSHGLTKEKENRTPVQLNEGQYVDIGFAHNGAQYAISITDYNGRLTKDRILESIHKVIKESKLILESFESGEDISQIVSETGRGIDLVRKMGGTCYFVIKEKTRTEILLIFESIEESRDEPLTSLRIIEDVS
jgi:DNA-binding response OmpR family regulator